MFFCIAPVSIAAWAPYGISGWRMWPPWFHLLALRPAGGVLIALGAAIVIECFVRFVAVGHGTPAPVAPPQRLVVSGLYRFVRNPMYVGVVTAILGQALLFANVRLLAYALLVWLGFSGWVLAYEEPALRRTFGPEFVRYCANVGRWWPRLAPWRG